MKKIFIASLGCLLINITIGQTKVDRTKPPAAGPAPVLQIGDPVSFKLSNGMTVLVVESHKLPKVTATYVVDYGPVTEGEKAGVMQIMGRMLNEGTTVHSKAAFDEEVDQMGSSVDLNESGGIASALTRYFDKAFMLMAEALQKPAFSQESFDKLKSQTITGLKSNDKSARAISGRVVNALFYGPHSAEGEFETEQTVNNLKVADIKQFYSKYITPSNGFLTFVGDITPGKAKELAEKAFGSWTGAKITLPVENDVSSPSKTEIDLVDVPNAVQSEITVGNVVKLPMNSPDYFPVLLANNILGGSADARLFMNLREKHGYTYGAYSSVAAGRWKTAFKATAQVRNEKVDSAIIQILYELNNIRTNKVSAEELKNAKALYAGNFALGLEDPARTAAFASNVIINKLPKDFYKTYLQRINTVTAEDIQRVAQKYFNYDNTRIVVVGKGDIVQPGLAKMGYALNMYDKFATPVSVELKSAASTSTQPTAQQIIDKFLIASGGASELKKINSVLSTGTMAVQGMSLAVSKKEMAPNMQIMEVNMNGQVVMKQLYNGTSGYRMQMGNKQNLTADEASEFKNQKGIFPQVYYNDGSYKLESAGMEKVDGKDAYKVNVSDASGNKSTEFYDVNSGLLVRLDKTVKAQGQEVAQTIVFTDYRKTGNVLLPYKNMLTVQTPAGSQDIEISLTDIKVNQGITAADFK
ncbi:MAG: hypothetical protein NVSMB45_06680 [Ginsengibacter sp.]